MSVVMTREENVFWLLVVYIGQIIFSCKQLNNMNNNAEKLPHFFRTVGWLVMYI